MTSTAPTQDAFSAARELQSLWKSEPMQRMARAVVALALDSPHGFAADDLPEQFAHGGSGIAGSVFAVLVNQGFIARAGIWSNGTFYGLERPSKRAGRRDAKVKVFRLVDAVKARTFLRRPRVQELVQVEMI